MALQTITARVKEAIRFVPGELIAIRFEPPADELKAWVPGDHFYIRIPKVTESMESVFKTDWLELTKPVIRAYTLSNWDDSYYEIVVVKESNPYVSELLQSVKPGDVLQISNKKFVFSGKLTMKPDDWKKKLLLFGGGTGLAHALSCARFVLKHPELDPDMWIVGSFRTREWVLFPEVFAELVSTKKNAKVAITLTREKELVDGYYSGRVVKTKRDGENKIVSLERNLFAELIPDIAERYPMLCGSDEMRDDVLYAWEHAGVPKANIKYESWG